MCNDRGASGPRAVACTWRRLPPSAAQPPLITGPDNSASHQICDIGYSPLPAGGDFGLQPRGVSVHVIPQLRGVVRHVIPDRGTGPLAYDGSGPANATQKMA